jgi:hypothetical protein
MTDNTMSRLKEQRVKQLSIKQEKTQHKKQKTEQHQSH